LAVDADAAAYARAGRPKPSKLATDPVLRARVTAKLVEDWSPQQIAARLRSIRASRPLRSYISRVRGWIPTALAYCGGAANRSTTRTRIPWRTSSVAGVSPTGPAPTMSTSQSIRSRPLALSANRDTRGHLFGLLPGPCHHCK